MISRKEEGVKMRGIGNNLTDYSISAHASRRIHGIIAGCGNNVDIS